MAMFEEGTIVRSIDDPYEREITHPLVTFLVTKGEIEDTFVILQDLVKEHCGSFRSMLIKQGTQPFACANVEPAVFRNFKLWLYEQTFNSVRKDLLTLTKLYLFGERFQVPALQNAAMDAIFDLATREHFVMDAAAFSLLWTKKKVQADTPLRKLLVELVIYHGPREAIGDLPTTVPAAMNQQLLVAYGRRFPVMLRGETAPTKGKYRVPLLSTR
ncbi:hypothetical protein MMC13_005325 [Lambiella insularis]|nr:hypothetical protein [Lambiella insularis]